MALSIAIEKARRRGATREAREAQNRAELRLTEIVKTAGIPDEYEHRDRARNRAVETAFATAYQLVDSEDERAAVTQAFMLWEADEKGERHDVRDLAEGTTSMLVKHNDVWLHNRDVPAEWLSDGCGPDGRAA